MEKMGKRNIAILGSTGSIGTQAIEVMLEQKEYFDVTLLAAFNNAELLIKQALRVQPNAVVIGNEQKYKQVKEALIPHDIKVFAGADALEQAVAMDSIDTVLTAMVGYAGLKPTLAAIQAGKDIALANKETLVVAGELITSIAHQKGVNIYPVDSEHSAIFQCIAGEFDYTINNQTAIEKIYLTASGGPFRGRNKDYLAQVKKEEALKHPNWDMGAKITIDSASLMNKGLEVIEAHWLFGLSAEQIDVIVHPQSIIHSIVQFIDGSMKAQMGLPDMKLPIQYALAYPYRMPASFKRFDFMHYPSLTFEKPDTENFPNLNLAYEALRQGGNMPCVINAANEVAVAYFLMDKISFLAMSKLIEICMQKVSFKKNPTLDDLVQTDKDSRAIAHELIKKNNL